MASWTIDYIQQMLAQELDQTATAPSTGGADWVLRLGYLNRAMVDFAETLDWSYLLKDYNTLTSNLSASVAGLATISLPLDFRKMAGYVAVTYDGTNAASFGQIEVTEAANYKPLDKFFYLLRSNPTAVMVLHSSIVSGASIGFQYYSSPQSLASTNDVPNIPDPTYLVQKVLYYVHKSNDDPRYVEAGDQTAIILQRMIENEVAFGIGWQNDRAKSWLERKSFKIGRN